MKKLKIQIKKWLGINKSELDMKLNEKDFEDYKKYLDRLYAECFNCGSYCRKSKMISLAVFKKDIPDDGVLSDYNLWYGFQTLYTGSTDFVDDKTTAIYFCKNCPAKLPKKEKKHKNFYPSN